MNNLEIVQVPAGPLMTNAFLVIDSGANEALIFDAPPESGEVIAFEISSRGVKPVGIVITHGHWDHVVDTADVKGRYNIPVMMHRLDQAMLENPGEREFQAVSPDRLLEDGDTVDLAGNAFTVMHTPGHCPGQISLYLEPAGVLLGGDTLFPNGYGRVDIPGASEADTLSTIARLLELPDSVTVYPGHGATTTIGRERPWMEQVVSSGRLL